MNAVEFVKKHGIEYTKGIIIGCESGLLPKNNNYAELKQIVNAWELVGSYGGIQRSKDHLNHRREYGLYQLPNLVQAINLVEQCQ